MITKSDCILLLTDIEKKGIPTIKMMSSLVNNPFPNMEVISFINSNRPLELKLFYEKLRKSYNNKKSSLYGNIVKEIEEPTKVITTLSSLLLQIFLFMNKVEDPQLFLKHSRADEISLVLKNYINNGNLIDAITLLRLIKADLKALENI